MILFKGISGHISNCRTRALKILWNLHWSKGWSTNCARFDLVYNFLGAIICSIKKKKSLRSFHDGIPIWQPISPSFLAMYCLPVFQIISESGWKWHFKSWNWQMYICFLYKLGNTEHNLWRLNSSLCRVALRKVRLTYQFTVHHLPLVIEV